MMTLAKGPFILRIDQDYKVPLINHINSVYHTTLVPAPHPQAFIRGTRTFTMRNLIFALSAVRCTSVRISAYGFKCAIHRFLDFASPDQPEAYNNTWDLGLMWNHNGIGLVQPRYEVGGSITHYPLLGPLGAGYGSTKMIIQAEGASYSVKIYSKIAHVIKSVLGHLLLYAPKTVFSLKSRKANLETLLEHFGTLQPSDFKGIRIEVTVQAPTLAAAVDQVRALPILNLREYLHPVHPDFRDFKIRARFIAVDDFINQARNLLEHTEEQLRIFRGPNTALTTPLQRQVCFDLFNVLGWNPGTFRVSKWDDRDSWWHLELLPPHGNNIIQLL
ncbi:hypothetical protein A4X13_0g9622 [Tilletia indica]|uniref:Uncharacterized protein n=1 Tax=Tilletia indica TaxID=43049 RepID=A0A8T8S8G9_9BASI|nr:hypothetical protein A4X13_0g9622 [Tilletia indica]